MLEEEILWLIDKFDFNFNLEKFRLEKIELETVAGILDEMKHTFNQNKTSIPQAEHELLDKLNKEADFYTMKTVKEAIKHLDTVHQIAIKSSQTKTLYNLITDESEFIHNEDLKNHIQRVFTKAIQNNKLDVLG